MPLSLSRSESFDEMVLDAVDRLPSRWAERLSLVEFAVEDVPLASDPRLAVPLGRVLQAAGPNPARVVVYRRPVEHRSAGTRSGASLVQDVVIELVAELMGIEPEAVDPDYGIG